MGRMGKEYGTPCISEHAIHGQITLKTSGHRNTFRYGNKHKTDILYFCDQGINYRVFIKYCVFL